MLDIQEIVMVEETEIPLVAEIEMVDSESEMVKAEVVEVVKAEAEVAEVVKGTNTITGSGIQEWIGLGNLIIVIHADVDMEDSTIMIIDENDHHAYPDRGHLPQRISAHLQEITAASSNQKIVEGSPNFESVEDNPLIHPGHLPLSYDGACGKLLECLAPF